MINASIITIGDELLIGQVIDTNSAFIAQQMNIAGFNIIRRVAVGDNYNGIKVFIYIVVLFFNLILLIWWLISSVGLSFIDNIFVNDWFLLNIGKSKKSWENNYK